MGEWRFCGRDAGVLRTAHPECRERPEQATAAVRQLVLSAVLEGGDSSDIRRRIEQAARGRVPYDEAQAVVLATWHEAVDQVVEDGVLTEAEEQRLSGLTHALGYETATLPEDVRTKLSMAGALREVMAGRVPVCPFAANGPLLFNFQRSEQLVWLFSGVRYIEEKTRRQYVGGSSGVSFRVMRGVYYRFGGSRGHVEEHTAMEPADSGLLAMTTKHIYFGGSRKSFRVPYGKIVSIQPYREGIAITRDAANARPQVFVTGNGWFAYNLAMNLSGMAT
ncbi:MAG: hypothetical protein IT208_17720 [Chthonomonadales bacterium]|nr:hypothetical protein [Chthonomonadales bacterium]